MGFIMGLGAIWICIELYRLTKDIKTPPEFKFDPPTPPPRKQRFLRDDGTPLEDIP